MREVLFTVESTFHIYGLGLALVGIRADKYGSVKAGDLLLIQKPDGSVTRLTVLGVEYPPSVVWIGESPGEPRYGVVVGDSNVPIGSIVARDTAGPSP